MAICWVTAVSAAPWWTDRIWRPFLIRWLELWPSLQCRRSPCHGRERHLWIIHLIPGVVCLGTTCWRHRPLATRQCMCRLGCNFRIQSFGNMSVLHSLALSNEERHATMSRIRGAKKLFDASIWCRQVRSLSKLGSLAAWTGSADGSIILHVFSTCTHVIPWWFWCAACILHHDLTPVQFKVGVWYELAFHDITQCNGCGCTQFNMTRHGNVIEDMPLPQPASACLSSVLPLAGTAAWGLRSHAHGHGRRGLMDHGCRDTMWSLTSKHDSRQPLLLSSDGNQARDYIERAARSQWYFFFLLETGETVEEPRNGNRRMNMCRTQANRADFTILVHYQHHRYCSTRIKVASATCGS